MIFAGSSEPYYRADLARIHHLGWAAHADAVAPGVLRLLEPVREAGGLVVELGCGSGLLTHHLVEAGHRVVATDASGAMLALAREHVPGAEEIQHLVLPHDPIPEADAIVSVGHAVSYLDDAEAVATAVTAIGAALRAGGLMAFDVCDLSWGRSREGGPGLGRTGDDWAVIIDFDLPAPDRFVRYIASFTLEADGRWRRDDETHVNTLVDTSLIPGLLAAVGVEAEVRRSFGTEILPEGLNVVVGSKPPATD